MGTKPSTATSGGQSKSEPRNRRSENSRSARARVKTTTTIQSKSRQAARYQRCATDDGHLELLETIYRAARLLHSDKGGKIADAVASWIRADRSTDLFELLIRAALPQVPRPVWKIWVEALSYSAQHDMSPRNVRAFVLLKSVWFRKTGRKNERTDLARGKPVRDDVAARTLRGTAVIVD
jgi:hypothetical protein